MLVLHIRIKKWFKWTHIVGSNDRYNTFGVIFRFKPRYLFQIWIWTLWYNQAQGLSFKVILSGLQILIILKKKVANRLQYIRCLKKAGLPTDELLRICLSQVCILCEYACQVCVTGLTEELWVGWSQSKVTHLTYEEGCNYLELSLIKDRHKELCV